MMLVLAKVRLIYYLGTDYHILYYSSFVHIIHFFVLNVDIMQVIMNIMCTK